MMNEKDKKEIEDAAYNAGYGEQASVVIEFAKKFDYAVNITGDACVGDEIFFVKAVFSGSFRNAKLTGFELITGKIVKDSYGKKKQQHTFTVLRSDGQKIQIKGRNLYSNGLFAKMRDVEARKLALEEKHERGSLARKKKLVRLTKSEHLSSLGGGYNGRFHKRSNA